MSEEVDEEVKSLRQECEWVLKQEVHSVLQELHSLLTEACKSFPAQIIPGADHDGVGRPEKYILSNSNGPQQIKCVMTLMGANICDAELSMRLQKTQGVATLTRVYPDAPWRLQQVQDASNYLLRALSLVDGIDQSTTLTSAQRILQLLQDVARFMNRGRACLAMPRRKTVSELVSNPNLGSLKPPLPKDVALSFYVQAQKVVLSVYSLTSVANKADVLSRVQAECTVPWLNDILVLFTLALQLCQQLTDKISVFAQYEAELQTSLLHASPAAVTSTLIDLNDKTYPHSSQQDPHSNQRHCHGNVHSDGSDSNTGSIVDNETDSRDTRRTLAASGDIGAQTLGWHGNAPRNQGDLLHAKDLTCFSGIQPTGRKSNVQEQQAFTDSHSIGLSTQSMSQSAQNPFLSSQSQAVSDNFKRVSGVDNVANLMEMGAAMDDTPVLMTKQGK